MSLRHSRPAQNQRPSPPSPGSTAHDAARQVLEPQSRHRSLDNVRQRRRMAISSRISPLTIGKHAVQPAIRLSTRRSARHGEPHNSPGHFRPGRTTARAQPKSPQRKLSGLGLSFRDFVPWRFCDASPRGSISARIPARPRNLHRLCSLPR